MDFDLPKSLGLLFLIVALGIAGLVGGGMMPLRTTLMMVLPSMLVFGLVAFGLGMKHGEYRTGR
jgi:hypothetical protein